MKTTEAAVPTKKVEVTLPVVKLRVDDLSYLQGIANREGKVKCKVPDSNYHRLILLGLIERVEIQPDPALMEAFERKRLERLSGIKAVVNASKVDWSAIRNACSPYWESPPRPDTDTRITEAGRALIKNGTARVEVKASCK